MLRLYKPLENHDIFKLHIMLEHLVCSVWCEANNRETCESKLNADFKKLYNSYEWLKKKIDVIYSKSIPLSDDEKKTIKDAFDTNNKIEELCNGTISPVYLDTLPEIVEKDIKPLLVEFYETLLERAKAPGTKQDYYQKLIAANEFQYCPCCGLSYFESGDSQDREAFDHYLPKSKYPFLCVNFKNLVPLCNKCNSDRKGTKDPIKEGSKAFYPFSGDPHNIQIDLIIDKSKNLRVLQREDLTINLTGDTEKIETWNRLFDIKERYNDVSRKLTKSLLHRIKRRHHIFTKDKRNWTFIDTLQELIDDYEIDKYEDWKFLKIPLMKDLKNSTNLIEVYA